MFKVYHWPYMQDYEEPLNEDDPPILKKYGVTDCMMRMSKYSWTNLSNWKTGGADALKMTAVVALGIVSNFI